MVQTSSSLQYKQKNLVVLLYQSYENLNYKCCSIYRNFYKPIYNLFLIRPE